MTVLDAKVPSGPIETTWQQHKFDMKLVAPNNKRKFEIIVVGTGLAGASAAATLARHADRRTVQAEDVETYVALFESVGRETESAPGAS